MASCANSLKSLYAERLVKCFDFSPEKPVEGIFLHQPHNLSGACKETLYLPVSSVSHKKHLSTVRTTVEQSAHRGYLSYSYTSYPLPLILEFNIQCMTTSRCCESSLFRNRSHLFCQHHTSARA